MAEEPKEEVTLEDTIQRTIVPKGGMLLRWVIVVEHLDPEAQKDIVVDNARDMEQWDVDGLLHYALENADWDDVEEEEE